MSQEQSLPVVRNDSTEIRFQVSPPPLALPYGVKSNSLFNKHEVFIRTSGTSVTPKPHGTLLTANEQYLEWNGGEKGELLWCSLLFMFCAIVIFIFEMIITGVPFGTGICIIISISLLYAGIKKNVLIYNI